MIDTIVKALQDIRDAIASDSEDDVDLATVLRGKSQGGKLVPATSLPVTVQPGEHVKLYIDVAKGTLLNCVTFAESGITGLDYTGGFELATGVDHDALGCTFVNSGSSAITLSSTDDLDDCFVSYRVFDV